MSLKSDYILNIECLKPPRTYQIFKLAYGFLLSSTPIRRSHCYLPVSLLSATLSPPSSIALKFSGKLF